MGHVYTYVYIIPQKKKALERFSRLVSCAHWPEMPLFLLVRQVGSHKIRPMLELSGFLHDTTI